MDNPAEKTPTDPYSPQLGDWRYATTGWVEAIDGKPVAEPMAMHQVTMFRVNEWTQFSFRTPSGAALHLNSAWKAAGRAHALKEQIKLSPPNIQPGRVGLHIQEESTGLLFDYFEEMMGAAMGSFGAIEAFCNQVIVDRASGPISVKRRKGHEQLSPEDIERQVSTEQKLGRIVPDLLGVSSPAGKAVWSAFDRIKDLRDAMTHFKRRDQARAATQEPTALFRLYTTDCFALPEASMEVVRYFHPDGNVPRWLKNPKWVRPAGA